MSAENFPAETSLVYLLNDCLNTAIPANPNNNILENVYPNLSTALGSFLKSLTNSDWLYVDAGIKAFLIDSSNNIYPGLRVLVSDSDGTVAYDSSKGINNTFANYGKKAINENHNTRVAISQALVLPSGVEVEAKFSNSVGTKQVYIAKRVGLDKRFSLGCIRVSYNVINF
jgi:hypothetical protein